MKLPELAHIAWRELRRSPIALARGSVELPAFLRRAAKQKPENQRTGMLPAVAQERLVADGATPEAAQLAVAQAIAASFRAFAGSWQGYTSNGGYLYDLWRLPQDQRARLAEQLRLNRLLDLTEQAAADPLTALTNMPLLQELAQLSQRTSNREDPQHPARVMLIEAHGFAPELATAVLLFGRSVPWWVHLLIFPMVLACVAIFILAVVDPHNQAFYTEDTQGAGPPHYIFLPLFALAMGAAEVYLLRNRKRWDKAWQDALAVWRATWTP